MGVIPHNWTSLILLKAYAEEVGDKLYRVEIRQCPHTGTKLKMRKLLTPAP